MRYYDDWRTFDKKFPHAGGLWDQPSMWHLLLGIVLTAERTAGRELAERRAQEEEVQQ